MYTKTFDKVIGAFVKMPGIGRRSAERLAFYVLGAPREWVEEFADALRILKKRVKDCRLCGNISEEEFCWICKEPSRDRSLICVVESPQDIVAIEKSREYKGLYYVLGGVLSPLEGITLDKLKIEGFLERIKKSDIKEVIIAIGSDTEGETTALYLKQVLEPFKLKLSRLAYGMPVGASLEWTDQATLSKAFEYRREI